MGAAKSGGHDVTGAVSASVGGWRWGASDPFGNRIELTGAAPS